MLAIYASAGLICLASLLVGRGLLAALGGRAWSWLEGAVGLAALTLVAQLAVRLPGRGATAAAVIGFLSLVALAYLWRARGLRLDREPLLAGLAVVVIVLLAGAVPFALAGHVGVLGEGIYSNDQAVHLYWADWLQNGIGPSPRGIGLGYPVGPHSLVAASAEVTGAGAEDAFNGFLLAVPALTALAALAVLRRLPFVPRVISASLVGLPYLAAAWLAQSSFKETATALYVLAFAVGLGMLERPAEAAEPRGDFIPERRRPIVVGLLLLPLGALLTLSLPALVWFVLGAAIWLVAAFATGRLPFSPRAALGWLRRGWVLIAAVLIGLGVLAALELDALRSFIDRVDEVQQSTGRLTERIPPWEVLGMWPEGDFRLPAGAVPGDWLAIAIGIAAAAVASVWWLRRRELGVPATLAAALAVYLYTLPFAGIHVEAKSLAVAAPLVALLVVTALLEPGDARPDPASRWRRVMPRAPRALRYGLGAVFVIAAAGSSFLALRQAPVGSTERARELESLRGQVADSSVAFLGLDRFAPYRLRGAELVRSPGGYVPEPLHARAGKEWEQSDAIDFDTLQSGLLNEFDYAITTTAAYQSSAPRNFEPVARTDSFILWKRSGEYERKVLKDEGPAPGAALSCADPLAGESGTAGLIGEPVLARAGAWRPKAEFLAPGSARIDLPLAPGRWALSIQYNSQVDLRLSYRGRQVELPASLEGMYAFAPGQGPFWPAGELRSRSSVATLRIEAEEPSALERAVHAERRVWLGKVAASPLGGGAAEPGPPKPRELPLDRACGNYLDWYQLEPR